MKRKEFLRHELLNIFTVLNVLLEEDFSKETKQRFQEILRSASFIITHEDVLLGNAPRFFRRENSLKEILEILLSTFESEVQQKKISVDLPEGELFLQIDRFYVEEALREILARLCPHIQKLAISFDDRKGVLKFRYDGRLDVDLSQKDFDQFLEKEFFSPEELPYQFALHVLELHSRRVSLSKNSMEIFLQESP